jgi:hypothetical protein
MALNSVSRSNGWAIVEASSFFCNAATFSEGPRRAAYDLKKLRAKNIVQRIGQTRRYQSTSSGLRAMVALVVAKKQSHKALVSRRSTPAQITRRTKSQTH